MSFSLCELECPSYEYVLDMTWREYTLRRIGYFRKHKSEWEKVRFITYYNLVSGGAIDTRKMSIEKFLPLDGNVKKKSTLSLSAIQAFKDAQETYLKETNE